MALLFPDLCPRKCLSLLFIPEARFAFLRQNFTDAALLLQQRFCLGCCREETRVRRDLPTYLCKTRSLRTTLQGVRSVGLFL